MNNETKKSISLISLGIVLVQFVIFMVFHAISAFEFAWYEVVIFMCKLEIYIVVIALFLFAAVYCFEIGSKHWRKN